MKPTLLDNILTAICAAGGLGSILYGCYLIHPSVAWIVAGLLAVVLAAGPPEKAQPKRGAR